MSRSVGDKWSAREDDVVRATAGLRPWEVRGLLPHRSMHAIIYRRSHLHAARSPRKAWTTTEDRILEKNIGLTYIAIAALLPGRTWRAVKGRAQYKGLRQGRLSRWLHKTPKTGQPLYDAIRRRALEDGIALHALATEVGAPMGHFQRRGTDARRGINWEYVNRAVAFFGGEIKIDWKDE